MPLFVRDDEITAMAAELQHLTKAPSKTEALRRALRNELARTRQQLPVRERLAAARATADAIGPSADGFDQKAFTDELWGE
ncbi:antitoxin VapB [Neorhizobium galegae]|uniref:type II toxin-antitoxin system VapB family antitoxin n=1 Tax=Neorhizobium galegae TaxID=399 RepID=UPI001AE64B95|nr:type II toxin-antitoxin system VapB family antitoxin [Neorhizobium galegae]MBP2548796.1 antitoxin VapB [Neorhizobium galegae]